MLDPIVFDGFWWLKGYDYSTHWQMQNKIVQLLFSQQLWAAESLSRPAELLWCCWNLQNTFLPNNVVADDDVIFVNGEDDDSMGFLVFA